MTPTDAHGNLRAGPRRRHRGKLISLHSTFLVVLAALVLLAPSAVANSPRASAVATPSVAAPKVLATFGAANAAETILYVATSSLPVGLVHLDVKTGRTIANIPAGWNAQTLALNAAETTAYTVNVTDGQLTVIDLRARRVQSVISVGQFAYGVTVNPAGTRAYINGFDSIVVVDLSTQKVVAEIPLTADITGRMHLNRAGTLGFSIAGHDGRAPAGGVLHVIDLASNTVVGTAPVCFLGNPMAFEPSGQRAYIPCGNTPGGTVNLVQMPQK